MGEAENIRCTGNRLFKEGKYELAKAKYDKVLRDFNHVHPQDDEEGKVFRNARNMLELNVAACYLKMGECRKSIDTCNKVLDANPGHAKALYRRGMAFLEVGDFEDAKKDFNMMMKVDKSSEADAKAALQKLKQREQEATRKAKKQFKGLFDKRPGEIADADVTTDKVEQEIDDNNLNKDTNEESKIENTEKVPQRNRGMWFKVSLIIFIICLVLLVFFLTIGRDLLDTSTPPDAMPIYEYDEL